MEVEGAAQQTGRPGRLQQRRPFPVDTHQEACSGSFIDSTSPQAHIVHCLDSARHGAQVIAHRDCKQRRKTGATVAFSRQVAAQQAAGRPCHPAMELTDGSWHAQSGSHRAADVHKAGARKHHAARGAEGLVGWLGWRVGSEGLPLLQPRGKYPSPVQHISSGRLFTLLPRLRHSLHGLSHRNRGVGGGGVDQRVVGACEQGAGGNGERAVRERGHSTWNAAAGGE